VIAIVCLGTHMAALRVELVDEALQQQPNSQIELSLAHLQKLVKAKQPLDIVLELANKVIGMIDAPALAAFFGFRTPTTETATEKERRSQQEKERTQLCTALQIKLSALVDALRESNSRKDTEPATRDQLLAEVQATHTELQV